MHVSFDGIGNSAALEDARSELYFVCLILSSRPRKGLNICVKNPLYSLLLCRPVVNPEVCKVHIRFALISVPKTGQSLFSLIELLGEGFLDRPSEYLRRNSPFFLVHCIPEVLNELGLF